jgi:hypothetical protein
MPIPDDLESKRQLIQSVREDGFASLGQLDINALAPLLPPMLMGGTPWPSERPEWRVIRRPQSTLIVSSGLSDPVKDDRGYIKLGCGMEIVGECAGWPKEPQNTALFGLVGQVSDALAEYGDIPEYIDGEGALSMQIPADDIPPEWHLADGTACALIGVPTLRIPKQLETPLGPIRLIVANLLKPQEAESILKSSNQQQARNMLASRMAATPAGYWCRA